MIKRIFHPIGQGAFYSERHEEFNIVYDCGNWRNTTLANNIVKQSFNKGETIDILFISHFDYDHVNKIKTLKDHTKIKKVIMPLLDKSEQILLTNIYRSLGFNILNLINKPEIFFDKDTQIITVNEVTVNEEPIEISDNIKIVNINVLKDTIDINTAIKMTNSYDWVYIPYNYKYQQRNKELKNKLKNEGFCISQLINNPNYTLNMSIKYRKQIKKAYEQVSGNINQNSMLVYSGPLPIHKEKFKRYIHHPHNIIYSRIYNINEEAKYTFLKIININFNKVGCIFTGDADLNQIDLSITFKKFLSNIGTIQIPHHGDIKSFQNGIFSNQGYLCPISFGLNNTYGHPSNALIADLLKFNNQPILVTENLDSYLIEDIKIL